jgi:beta-mannosidase
MLSANEIADSEGTELVCLGLDTVAAVLVNGVAVGRTSNQHRVHRFPVASLLREGDNTIEVVFDDAWPHAESLRDELGPLPNAYPAPFNFIRKMACNFGWDWGQRW